MEYISTIKDKDENIIYPVTSDAAVVDDNGISVRSKYEVSANKISSWQSIPDNTHYPSEKLIKDSLEDLAEIVERKQDTISDIAAIRSNAAAGAALGSRVTAIEGKIPSQASDSNQLADKAFVNSSIATNTAYFRGTYDVVNDLHLTFDATEAQVAAALASIITEVTNNDYAFVVFVDTTTELPTRYDRYKYGTQDNSWQYEYTLNNSSFTANEWAAIQSGITSGLVAKLGALPTAAEFASALLGKEDAANKVTSLSSTSTDEQYPSAKCVYDIIGNIESLLTAI